MPVTYPTKIIVWTASAGLCSKCKKTLLKTLTDSSDLSAQGEIAHIEGENEGSKRYNPEQTEKDRNSFPNLVLMCPNCHTEIDNDSMQYTVVALKFLKLEHESWVKQKLNIASYSITFSELEVVLRYLSSSTLNSDTIDFKLITPNEKIIKNKLSQNVSDYITMGMVRTPIVIDYLNRNPDVNFANRLRKGFIEKYQEFKKTLGEDELF